MQSREKLHDVTSDDVVAYLTKASAEERWSILERVALATRDSGLPTPVPRPVPRDSAVPTPVRKPLELVDQTLDDRESAPPPIVAEGPREEAPIVEAAPVAQAPAAEAPAPEAPIALAPIVPSPIVPIDTVPPPSSLTTTDAVESAPATESLVPPTLPSSVPPPSVAPQPSAPPRAEATDAAELLFEAMHDLTLLESAADGARFCLEVALRAVPCLAGLVHLRDPATLELVVVHTQGPRADTLLRTQTPQSDPLVARAARAGRPVVVAYGGIPGTEETPCPRHTFFDPWSAAVVPVMHGGQLLGLIELIDPLDGAPFGDAAQDALAYVAERLGGFLVDHPAAAISA